MRTFAYTRVSTTDQTTEQQLHAIELAGYTVESHRVVKETISGKTPALLRPIFAELLNKIESGDTLIVNKLDRLGRNNVDLQNTIEGLTTRGIKVICLDLPVKDLSSSEGKLVLQLFASFAEFERNRISERTREALAKKKADGTKLGRPIAVKTTIDIQACKIEGLSQSKTAKKLNVSLTTVKRHWNK